MPSVPLHVAIAKLSLGLAFALPFAMGILAVGLWRGTIPRRTWLVALALQTVLVAGAAVALRVGTGDEDRVEPLGIRPVVERHHDVAEVFVWSAGIVLAIAALAPAAPARGAAVLAAFAAAGAVLVAALAYRVEISGGELSAARAASELARDVGPG